MKSLSEIQIMLILTSVNVTMWSLPIITSQNDVIWTNSSNGNFSFKSAYDLLQDWERGISRG